MDDFCVAFLSRNGETGLIKHAFYVKFRRFELFIYSVASLFLPRRIFESLFLSLFCSKSYFNDLFFSYYLFCNPLEELIKRYTKSISSSDVYMVTLGKK